MRADTACGHITGKRDLQEYMEGIVEAGPLVIKPNWTNSLPVNVPHFQALTMLVECLEKPPIVTESYSAWRNRPYRQYFQQTGSILWEPCVTPHNAWEMQEWIREEDRWFLDFYGFRKWFEEYGVEYVNVTEEMWNKRVVPGEVVKGYVGERQPLIGNPVFYQMVPERLARLRGCTLLNFTKVYPTGIYAAKNMMGFIPDPNRTAYHGDEDATLIQTIHDINVVYRSLFKVVDVVESVVDHQFILSGTNPARLDEIGCVVLGTELVDSYHNVAQMKEIFGSYSPFTLSDIPVFVREGIKSCQRSGP